MSGSAHYAEGFTSGDCGAHLQARGHGLVGGAISGAMGEDHGGHVVDLTDEGEGAIGGGADRASDRGGEIHASMAAPITPGRRGKRAKELGSCQRQAPRVQGVGRAGRRGGGGERQTGGSQGQGASDH